MKEKLALDGGTPVRENMLPYGKQTLDAADINAVVEALQSDFLTTGPKVSEFEEKFASQVGAEYAVAVNSGTAALHCALFAANVKPEDEVITTPLTFVATANAIRYLGAKVIFADICPDTLNIDPEKLEKLITSKTKAIVVVDYAGHPCDLDKITSIAKKHNLLVIEDAAHSLGALYNNRPVGSIADLTTFSLHPVKHITTGEGGLITTNSKDLASRLRLFRNHGMSIDYKDREKSGSWIYDVVELGFNYRLTDFQSALGITQLQKLQDLVARRREIAEIYTRELQDIKEIELPLERHNCNSSWHLYVIKLKLDNLNANRADIFASLRAENIGVNVHYIPVYRHTLYKNLLSNNEKFPITDAIYEQILSLPIWPKMQQQDILDTVNAVRKVIKAYSK